LKKNVRKNPINIFPILTNAKGDFHLKTSYETFSSRDLKGKKNQCNKGENKSIKFE